MYCTKCGEALDSQDRFCRHCGESRPPDSAKRFEAAFPPSVGPSEAGYWHTYVRPFFMTAGLFIAGLCGFFLVLKLLWAFWGGE